MASASEPSFERLLAECRKRFERRHSGVLQRLLMQRPLKVDLGGIDETLRIVYPHLLERGCVVWGAVAQVNRRMLTPGSEDLPGVTVHSLDPRYDARPQDLAEIGKACFEFKGTVPDDAEYRPLAERLSDEFDFSHRMAIPKRLADGRAAFIGATMFHRNWLPTGILEANVFPMVVAPRITDVNMPLPLAYWPPALVEAWSVLEARLSSASIASSARRVACKAKKRTLEHWGPVWDSAATPVYVTRALAKEMAATDKRQGRSAASMLSLCLQPDGEKQGRFVTTHDPHIETIHASNGVNVVLRKDQVDKLRGSWVDFKSSAFGTGLVFRLPDE